MKERFELLEKAILTMVEEKKYSTLRDILVTMNPADIAGVFNSMELEDKRIPLMYRLLPKELAAVCDEIVQMHNGTLTLENAEGGGTLVTVTIPAC